jgi:antitoxin component YwqK of YwqJK toxin-antitoxin module
MRKILVFCVLTFLLNQSFAQQQSDKQFVTFSYPNGIKSSEGYLVNGKPDGYWFTYYENGKIKSEGNRRNFELDSLWKFYEEDGKLKLEINYRNGRKSGKRISYLPDETIHENFENDIKIGLTNTFLPNGKLIKSVPFEKGLEEGIAREYDTTGIIIELVTYKKGFITAREKINRSDAENKKQGVWKWFYTDGTIQLEGVYKHGLKNGVFKYYDPKGNLKTIEKYLDDQKQQDAEEVAKLEIKRDYFPNGKVKIEGTYRNGLAEGVRREFNEAGEVEKSYLMKSGQVTAEGIIEASGQRKGEWKEFFPDGKTKAKGLYVDDFKSGYWEYYHQNGMVEQKGKYDAKGRLSGLWQWFDENGNVLREENFRNGLNDGQLTEYDSQGKIIVQGEFIDGKEEGKWLFLTAGVRTEGEFTEGLRSGNWKTWYANGTLAFEGRFVDDNPNGKHTTYYANGSVREEGDYIMGLKDGEWRKYDENGVQLISISYKNGIERKYDGIPIPDEDVTKEED